MMKKSKYLWNFLLILVITVIVLYFALKDDYQLVLSAFSRMNPFSMILILAWGLMYTIVWGFVYFVLGRKYKKTYSAGEGIIVALVGSFFAGVTPSATGGQFGQAYIFKKQGIKYADGASILWADFIIYQTTMMIYCTFLFVFKYGEFAGRSAWFLLVLAGYLVNLAVVLGLYTMALFPKVYIKLARLAVKWLDRLHLLKNSQATLENWTMQMTSFTVQIKELSQDKKSIFICFLINMVRLTLLYSLPYAVGWALGIQLPLKSLVEVIALSSFVTMANSFIPIPGASGGTEVMFSVLFSPLYGIMTNAVMILWRLSSYYIVILIGGLTFFFATRYYDKRDCSKVSEE